MIKQGIQDFYAQAQSRGFSRDFQLRVTGWQFRGAPVFTENELVYIKTITLPSKKIENVKAPFMGVNFNVPGVATYPNSESWSVTLYADQVLDLRARLETALDITFSSLNPQNSNIELPGTDSVIQLSLLNDNMEEIKQYKLFGAYITDIGTIEYKTTGNGTIQEIKTTVAYQFWASGGFDKIQRGSRLTVLGQAANTLNDLQRIANVFR